MFVLRTNSHTQQFPSNWKQTNIIAIFCYCIDIRVKICLQLCLAGQMPSITTLPPFTFHGRDASPSEIYSSWPLPLASAEIVIVYYRVPTYLDNMEKAGRIIVVREGQGIIFSC